ncbi:hypothetical protein [Pseudochelatococcus sp. G4_1912]|uniref:hypothetical protein n=1 Tax=Pseudochelatococcus sp. G4_1912 TaxID=3114288 RepID=UPI0039C69CD0
MGEMVRLNDLDILMQKVRADVEARKARVDAEAYALNDAEELPPPIDVNRMRYTAAELLANYDVVFLRSAYLAILGQEPDGDNAAQYLQDLRLGQLSRIDVLDCLLATDEARARGVRVSGLRRERFIERARRSVFGRKLGVLVRIAGNIPRLASYMRQVIARVDTAESKLQKLERHLIEAQAERQTCEALINQHLQAMTLQISELQERLNVDAVANARK